MMTWPHMQFNFYSNNKYAGFLHFKQEVFKFAPVTMQLFFSCGGEAWTGLRIYSDGSGSWRLEGDNGDSVDEAFIDTLWDPTVPDDPNEVTSHINLILCLNLFNSRHLLLGDSFVWT